jgi:hypothetical protein
MFSFFDMPNCHFTGALILDAASLYSTQFTENPLRASTISCRKTTQRDVKVDILLFLSSI